MATGSETGYAPYIDLILPTNGADGTGTGNAPVNDGVTLVSVTYLNRPVTQYLIEFDASGHATHPFAVDAAGNPLIITGIPGNTLLVLKLPFGSFTTEQTPADIVVTLNVSNLADVGKPLAVTATGGFAFGADELNNPGLDAPIQGDTASTIITPTVAILHKDYVGPEQETATGPSYPREWKVVAEFAPKQVFTHVTLTDDLPDGVIVLGTHLEVNGATVASAGPITLVRNADGTQTVRGEFAQSITGGDDVPVLVIDFYVDEFLWKTGEPVLNPETGAFRDMNNNAQLDADWQPMDGRDAPTHININPDGYENIVTAKSVAVQKSVALVDPNDPGIINPDADANGVPDWQPGGTLKYTLDGQVSNYFEMKNLVFKDTLGDGQTFKPGFEPQITISEAGQVIYSGAVLYTASAKDADGRTFLQFDVAGTLRKAGIIDDVLDGNGEQVGDVPHAKDYNQATAVVTFETTIDHDYTGPIAPGLDRLVDQGDPIGNDVLFGGDVFNTGKYIEDDSHAGVTLPVSAVDKSIYAINHDTALGSSSFNVAPKIQSGDLITYRLTLDMPLTSAHAVKLSDYLPLPVLRALDLDANGTADGAMTRAADGAIPGVGQWSYGPTDTLHNNGATSFTDPSITRSGPGNSLTFNFGDITNPNYPTTHIDLLFTVRVNDAAFGDGLLLTNQVTSSETNSFGLVSKDNEIIQFVLGEPRLKITKGIVAEDNNTGAYFDSATGPSGISWNAPGSATAFNGTITSQAVYTTIMGNPNPVLVHQGLADQAVNANLIQADARDTVTFAIVLENLGSGPRGAFDTLIRDTLPPGFTLGATPLNLHVTDGTGAALAYTGNPADLFTTGIELVDAGLHQGAIAAYDAFSGKNIVVITYDLKLDDGVQSTQSIVNTATTAHYAAEEKGIDRTPTDKLPDSDNAYVSVTPQVAKTYVSSSNADTGFSEGNGGVPDLAIGETVTWHFTATIPEGTTRSLKLIDILPGGNFSFSGGPFELVSVTAATVGSHISGTGVAAGTTGVISDSNGDGVMDTVTFSFGDVFNNPDNIATVDDLISFDITARVLDKPANYAGETEYNRATVQSTAPDGTVRNVDTSAAVEIVEPHLNIDKSVTPTNVDAADTFTYTVTLTNTNNSYGAPAYEVSIDDLLAQLPPNAKFLPGTVTLVGTQPGGTAIITGNGAADSTVKVTTPRLLEGQSITFTFQAKATDTAISGQTIPNTATATGTSMPGQPPSDRGYTVQDDAAVTINKPGIVKSIIDTSYADTGSAQFNANNPDVKVNEVVTYRIVVTLPEGEIVNLKISDVLEDIINGTNNNGQLLYVPGSAVISYGANLYSDAGFTTHLATPTSFTAGNGPNSQDAASTDQLIWSFGNVYNKPDANNASGVQDQIIITLQAKAANVGANASADVLTNTATVTADNGINYSSSVDVDFVEPKLDVQKSASFDSGRASGDAGDIATFSVVISHLGGNSVNRSSATAYDVDLSDLLPAGVSYVANSLSVPAGVTASVNAASKLTLHADSLALGQTITVTYKVQLLDDVVNTQSIVNVADLDWQTHAPGQVDAPGRTFTDSDDAILPVVITDNFAKSIYSTDNAYTSGSNLAVGERVTYLLTATLGEGSQHLIIRDALPTGLTYVSSQVLSIASPISGSTLAVGAAGTASGQNVLFDFGTVQNLGNNTGIDTVQVLVTAVVNTGVARGTLLDNVATLAPTIGTNPYGVNPNQPMPEIVKNAPATVVSAKVGNQIFEDRDANGVYNTAIDAPLSGVLVTLRDAGGNVVATATTTADGKYLFDNLVPGVYSETFGMPNTPAQPGTWYRSPTGTGLTDNDSDAASNGDGQTITLNDNAVDLTHDAGYFRKVSLGDTAFIDVNGNGIQDDGAAAVLGNVKVELLNGAGTVINTAFTDGQGQYAFTDLTPGQYAVRFTAPNGSVYVLTPKDQGGSDALDSDASGAGTQSGTTPTKTYYSGDGHDPTVDAGFYIPAKLGDRAFIDANGNGTFDLGENGLDGVTVKLFAAGNPVAIATATTSGGGYYLFEGLRPGTYTESFTSPGGSTWVLTKQGAGAAVNNDSDPNGTGTPTGTGPAISLVSGQDDRTHDAGFYQPLSIGDKVFYDVNGDGVQGGAGEVGIQNVTVTLVDVAGNPVAGVSPLLTDANGNYTFTGLPPGVYGVKFTTPAGYQVTTPDQGGNDATDSDINAAGLTPTRQYVSGENDTTVDAGFWKPVALGDTVFLDNNGNGVQDGGEVGVANITVNLLDALGQAISGKTTVTDGMGHYAFTNLAPGTYGVQFVMSGGYLLTRQDAGGNDALDSDANPATGKTGGTTIPAGTVNNTIDAGVYKPVTIGNYAFDDKNGNGIQDAGDNGVGGVTVKLINDNFPAETYTQVTAPDGSYLFTNLPPGSYHEEFSAPAGYVFTPNGQGTAASDSDPNPANGVAPGFSIASGQTDLTHDVGMYIPVKIGDRVFEDQNGNGIQDAGDTNLAGVTVKLLDGANIVKGTAVTDANGNYLFTGLPPGSYHIQVVKPAGYEFTAADTGLNDAIDSDTNTTTGISPTKTYISGDDDRSIDSGLYRPVKIGDTAFLDRNGDGIQNAGDTPLAGVTVQLVNTITGAVVATATTGADGAYLFTVPPGTYKEIWTAPAGYVPTITGQGTNATDSNPDPLTGMTTPITLTSGQSDLTQDGGFYVPVKIGDRVFEDQNGNGIQDAEDTNLAGVTVKLLDGAGNVVGQQTTDANGNYLFSGLRPQDYQVQFVKPTGFITTAPDTGLNDAIDSDASTTTGLAPRKTYYSGDDDRTIDAGYYRPVTIGDHAFIDINKDGLQQALEPGLAGVTVTLIDDRTGLVVGTQATNANGDYLFTGYKPSEYHVEFGTPAGYSITTALVGGNRAIDSNPNALGVAPQIRLLSGQSDLTIDAGYQGSGRVSGNVFLDLPPGICNYKLPDAVFTSIKVELITTTGLIAGITTTDAQGNYSFGNVAPGQYIERFTNPDGTVFMQPKVAGTLNPRDSDVNLDGTTDVFTVTNSSDIKMLNAGLDYTGVGFQGQAATHLPDGGGSYNFQGGAYAIGGNGSYNLIGNGGAPVYFIGGSGSNNLQGSGASGAILMGGGGSNIMEGTGGRDIIIGGCGTNNIQGLGSNNFQGLGSGNGCWNYDLLVGGVQNDIITSNSGNAIIIGGRGDDALDGQGVFVGGPNNGTVSYSGTSITGYSVGDHIKISGLSTVNYQVGDGVQWIENFNPGRGDTIEVWGYAAPTATGLVNGQYVMYFGPNSAIVLNGYQPQNGPLTGVNYHPDQAAMPGAFGHLDALPPVILAPGQDSFYGSQGDDIVIATDAFSVLRGNAGDDIMFGGEGGNLFIGGPGNDTMIGGRGNDIFRAGEGSDQIIGCEGNNVVQFDVTRAQATITQNGNGTFTVKTPAGEQILKDIQWVSFTDQNVHLAGVADAAGAVLFGTAGNDHFQISNAADMIVERVGAGTDTAWVSVNGWTLSPEVENGRLLGNGTDLSGNALDNVLVANATRASTIHAGSGNDEIWGGAANGSILDGGAGDDVIRSGTGAETMIGGTGNDQFVVNNAGDVVTEKAGEGTDTAWVGVNGWSVGANVEIVRLFNGASSVNFAGNAQVVADVSGSTITAQLGDNVFWGQGGADTFVGAAGSDIFYAGGGVTRMYGGAGNDHYIIKNLGDQAFENANEGYDTAYVTVNNWNVGNNIEVAYLSGSATALTGNGTGGNLVANSTAASTLTAGAGLTTFWGSGFGDTFNAGPGGSTMYGYGGADDFHFGVAHWGTSEIADFSAAEGDKLDFRGSGITGLGQLTIQNYADKVQILHGADQIVLYGVTAPLVNSDFIF